MITQYFLTYIYIFISIYYIYIYIYIYLLYIYIYLYAYKNAYTHICATYVIYAYMCLRMPMHTFCSDPRVCSFSGVGYLGAHIGATCFCWPLVGPPCLKCFGYARHLKTISINPWDDVLITMTERRTLDGQTKHRCKGMPALGVYTYRYMPIFTPRTTNLLSSLHVYMLISQQI